MAKTVITFFLSLIIILTCAFATLYICFNFKDPGNTVNTMMRKHVMMHPLLRKIFRLQQVGDARYEYMYKRAMPLEIHLYYQEGVTLEPQTLEKITREIQFATHKYAQITIHPPQILPNIPDKVDVGDINTLLDAYAADASLLSDTVPLHIFLLKYYLPHPSYAGLVTDAHSMLLFKNPIEYVSDEGPSRVAVEISTILHEFAHLGGAEHIPNKDCILADTVENLDFFSKIETIRDSYCDEDLQEILRAASY